MRYKPFGEKRSEWNAYFSPNKFTGQREEYALGSLYHYGARFYSPLLGRFISADTVVPGAGNPQAFNRYSYVLNSPLVFTDPTGHDALGADWVREFRDAHGRDPNDEDRQIRLFSLTRTGAVSGENDWTAADWAEFHRRGRNYWFREDLTGRRTLSGFSSQISRLAQAYTDAEPDQFVRAIALLYAGLPYDTRGPRAALAQGFGGDRITVSTCGGREDACLWLDHRSVGFSRQFTNSDLEENTHHYAGHLLSGFYLGPSTNMNGTFGREIRQGVTERQDILATDMADVRLGAVAGMHGYLLQTDYIRVSELSGWIARGLAP